MPPIFSSTLRAWATARATMVLHAAESPPPAQDLAVRKFGSGLTLRAGFFGGRTPLPGKRRPGKPGPGKRRPGRPGPGKRRPGKREPGKRGHGEGDSAEARRRPECRHGLLLSAGA